MTVYETKKIYLEELGLLERYSLSEEFKELNSLDQEKILHRIAELEPFVELLTNINGARKDEPRPVVMYTFEGKTVRIFKTTQDAATYMGDGKNISPIRRVLNLKRNKYKGFAFRYLGSGIPIAEIQTLLADKKKPVQQMKQSSTGFWRILRQFSSIQEAAEFIKPENVSSASERISLCCQGKQETYKGYGWKFKNQSKLNYG